MSEPQRLETCGNCKFYEKRYRFGTGAEDFPHYWTGHCKIISPIRHAKQTGELRSNDWCGEWQPVGNSHALVFADYLEEKGFKAAADVLRKFDSK